MTQKSKAQTNGSGFLGRLERLSLILPVFSLLLVVGANLWGWWLFPERGMAWAIQMGMFCFVVLLIELTTDPTHDPRAVRSKRLFMRVFFAAVALIIRVWLFLILC